MHNILTGEAILLFFQVSKFLSQMLLLSRAVEITGISITQNEEGKEAQELKPGDVVNIPANVKHWHGAAKDSWFQHLAIEVAGEETSNEWCEPVSPEEYSRLK